MWIAELRPLISSQLDAITILVDIAVVMTAEQTGILERCLSAIGPVSDMMPFQEDPVCTARICAGGVALEQRTLDRAGDRAALASDRQRHDSSVQVTRRRSTEVCFCLGLTIPPSVHSEGLGRAHVGACMRGRRATRRCHAAFTTRVGAGPAPEPPSRTTRSRSIPRRGSSASAIEPHMGSISSVMYTSIVTNESPSGSGASRKPSAR
jgi:hypothetical protein